MNEPVDELRVIPLPIRGEISVGERLDAKILEACRQTRVSFQAGDILIVKHKVVSKAEGSIVDLGKMQPSTSTKAWAKQYKLDARVTQLALREAKKVIRRKNGVLITETKHGFICANSGVDVSNVDGGRHAVLLPRDADRSARRLHRALLKKLSFSVPVIICDSWGRAWREGLTEAAIGIAGMKALNDYRGTRDAHGYELHATVEAVADQLACAAGLVCGKLSNTPACIIRGFRYQAGPGSSRDLLRPVKNDLFR
ncbi:MAG TPA: coenzyme F420-0:L-glutamate ligase [Terriglobales bacterium]|jgi:coenzyme F420-0:L-glutamate ligase / coenzyme F420-1:gamma-L-glutamate ligase|nr:coenzyme F420-0:L-glutamate ligase [Terriglobales bacterium]